MLKTDTLVDLNIHDIDDKVKFETDLNNISGHFQTLFQSEIHCCLFNVTNV